MAKDHKQARIVHVVAGCLAACFAMAGCSSSESGSPVRSVAASVPVSSGRSASAAVSSGAVVQGGSGDGATCGADAVAAVTKALKSYPAVTRVAVISACHELNIQTSLPYADPLSPASTKAVLICRAARKVAYTGAISSITVDWANHDQAALGVKEADCIPAG